MNRVLSIILLGWLVSIVGLAQDAMLRIDDLFTATIETDAGPLQMTFRVLKNGVVEPGIGQYGQAAIDTTTAGRIVLPDSVTDPNGLRRKVTRIGRQAFAHCSRLTEVVMPQDLIIIGDQAFYGCSSLRTLTLPPKLQTIYPYAFRGCSSLSLIRVECRKQPVVYDSIFDLQTFDRATLFIPAGTTASYTNSLVWGMFLYRMEMMDQTVDSYDFSQDGIFYKITGENTVQVTYKAEAKDNADTYTGAIRIPRQISKNGATYTVTAIGEEAFYYCDRLTTVTIPQTVTTIGKLAFGECHGLTSASIPTSVTSIGNGAFSGCHSLADLTIPEGIEKIDEWAFAGCSTLTSVTIPKSVKSIDAHAFRACTSLSSIDIPSTVTRIGSYAFSECPNLTDVILPEDLTTLDEGTFRACSSLESVTIPEKVTSIGNWAFSACSGLKTVSIPNAVTRIGNDAFKDCTALTCLTIPDSVAVIDGYAFRDCSSMQSITFNGTTPPVFGENVLTGTTCPVIVPKESLAAYKVAKNFTIYADRIRVED